MSAARLLVELQGSGIQVWVTEGRLRYSEARAGALTSSLRTEIENHRADLIRLLDMARVPAAAVITTVAGDEPVQVSFAQERFLFLERLQGPAATFNLTSSFTLRGALDIAALEWALGALVRRHEVLRTTFDLSTDIPTQRVGDFSPSLPVEDLTALPEGEGAARAEAITRTQMQRPFDIVRGPCLRCLLLRLAPDEHRLVAVLHHIVSDGESIPVFLRELAELYAARTSGRPPALGALPVQYRDFAHWQRNAVSSGSFQRQVEFWRQRLANAPAHLRLPGDRPPKAAQTFAGSSVTFMLDAQPAAAAATSGPTMTEYHRLLAALAILLARHTHQDDIVIGSPIANRRNRETEALIGPFLNLLPLRLQLAGLETLQQVLECARTVTLQSLDNGDVPFQQIVHVAGPARGAEHMPLFQVMFAFESSPVHAIELPGLSVETHLIADGTAKYDFTLVVHRRGAKLLCEFKYNRDRFDAGTIDRLAQHYQHIVAALARDSAQSFRRLPLGSAHEQAQLDAFSRGPARPYPIDRPLHTFFEAQAERTPTAIALDFEGDRLDYRALDRRANQLAHRLIRLGVGPEVLVAICMERCLDLVVAVLGVLKAGGAYVPIDPDYPPERRSFMLSDAGARVMLTHRRLAQPVHGEQVIALDADAASIVDEPEDRPACSAHAHSACYVIYTSGSTGRPKAVLTEHEAICNNLLWMQDEWPLGPDDVLLFKSSFSFDVSLKEIIWPLMAGARVRIARPGGQRDPSYVHQVVRDAKVTIVHLVPSMLEYFLQHAEGDSATLRIVMCGGEALSFGLKNRFCSQFRATLLHLYGPTEAAIAVTASTYTSETLDEPVSLGRPMPNAQIHVLDERLERVPIGVWGELHIGGTPLARAYIRRPELTAERFIPDRFAGVAGARLYRTGDLVRWRPGGTLEYGGRIDRQLKIRGLRVEPGEIEEAIRAHAPVLQAAVAMSADAVGTRYLSAYVVWKDAPGDVEGLREFLRARLPPFMVPERLVSLTALPLGPNGKVDFDALVELPTAVPSGAEVPADAADLEGLVERAWYEVLDRSPIPHHANFFDAGGHSLAVGRLQRRLQELTGRELPLADFFAYPTIARMARHLAGAAAATAIRATPAAAAAADSDDGGIAVIGMAARLPGAPDIETFWSQVLQGREAIHFFSEDELLRAGVPDDVLADPAYVRSRGVLENSDAFDAEFFGYRPREADLLDPQFRLLLETAQHALDDAGCDPTGSERETRTAAFIAVSRSTYFLNVLSRVPRLLQTMGAQQVALATDKSFAATQLAYRFDLHGPCITIDTACSSSLVAIHVACECLRRGEARVAIVGGASVDAPMTAGYYYQSGNIAAPDGHCRPFDANAQGTVKGSGVGVVVLKRLADALADGDRISVVIRGSAVNNDGADKVSFTAPSEHAQAAVIRAALTAARVEPESIGYLEAHGTGTVLGDLIELSALATVFRAGRVVLGSAKAGIGHLDAAAGIASFIKTALAIRNGRIPPLINFAHPHPKLAASGSPFIVSAAAQDWPLGKRRAGVSSFGIGGTNAHVVLEEASQHCAAADDTQEELIALSAPSRAGLEALANDLAAWLARDQSATLAEIAFTLASRRPGELRTAISARTHAELRDRLTELARQLAAGGTPSPAPLDATADRLRFADRRRYRKVSLPGYPFQRARHWIDPPPERAGTWNEGVAPSGGIEVPTWTRLPAAQQDATIRNWFAVGDPQDTTPLCDALLSAGCSVIVTAPGDDFAARLAQWRTVAAPRGVIYCHATRSPEPGRTGHRDFDAGALRAFADRLEALGDVQRLCLLTCAALRIDGTETIDLTGRALHSFVELTALRADARLTALGVDFDARARVDARLLRGEVLSKATGSCGWRNGYRWSRHWMPMPAPDLEAHGPLEGKSYVLATSDSEVGAAIRDFLAAAGLAKRPGKIHGAFFDLAGSGLADGSGSSLSSLAHSAETIQRCFQEIRDFVTDLGPDLKTGVLFAPIGPRSTDHPALRCLADLCVSWLETRAASEAWTVLGTDCLFEGRFKRSIYTPDALTFLTRLASTRRFPELGVSAAWLARNTSVHAVPATNGTGPGSVQAAVTRVWTELLGVAPREEVDFFAAGGDSLLATQLVARLSQECAVRLDADDFLLEPRPSGLIALIEAALATAPAGDERETLEI